MALVLVEGFDHYDGRGFTGFDWLAAKGWNGAAFGSVTGRDGIGQGIDVIANNPVYKQMASSYSTFVLGVAISLSDWGVGDFLHLEDSGTFIAGISVGGDGRLYVTDAAARTYPAVSIMPTTSWFYIELKIVIGTSGSYELRLNGSPTPEISGTGNFGTNQINRVAFFCHGIPGSIHVDDLYGDDANFHGDIVVRTQYPNADGTYSQWTPDAGTAHYPLVSETLADGDGSFVYDSTVGDKDSYTMTPLVANSVKGVQLNLGARKGDAGLREIAPLIRQAGVDHVGPTETLSQDYVFYSWLLENDPTGVAWTATTIAADEFGMEVIA